MSRPSGSSDASDDPTSLFVRTVETAVSSLMKLKEEKTKTKNPKLTPEDEFINLILTLKKTSQKSRTHPIKIPLPNPLHTPSSSKVCLIIDYRLTEEDVNKIIKEKSLPISKIIPFSKIKTDYKLYEAKKKLCDSYDLFLVDESIVHLLPKLLGKHFLNKNKLPLPVNLSRNNWGEKVKIVCSSGLLYIRKGACSVMKIGKFVMSEDEIVKNVIQGIEGIVNVMPKSDIKSLHLKFSDSEALPLPLPDTKLKIESVKKVDELSESEGNNKTKKKRKRKRKDSLA